MTLLDHLRDYLVGLDIVRYPRLPGSLPPMWLEPKAGAPAPGEGRNEVERGPDATVSAFLTGGIPQQPYESFWRRDTVDIWLRTTTAPIAFDLDARLRAVLSDQRNFNMAGERIISSEQWRALQRLGSDEQGYTFIVSYLIEQYVEEALQVF